MKNFRDPTRREHFVYRVYDDADRLLYIGCTNRPALRWSEHRAWSRDGWPQKARRFRVSGPYNYDTARSRERDEIEELDPRHNHDGPWRRRHDRLVQEIKAEWIGWGADDRTAGRVATAIADEVIRVTRDGEPGERESA